MLLDTIAACGDDCPRRDVLGEPARLCVARRGLCAGQARQRPCDPADARLSRDLVRRAERVAGSEPEEPFYGRTYLPRKFKIGFVIPPSNDIDVYTQDLGFIAIAGSDGLEGFNVAIGGGMGRTDQAPATYPRLADVIGFVPADKVLATATP